MKRQLIVIGLAIAAFLLFAFITATLAGPQKIPPLQPNNEVEPNDDFEHANSVSIPGYVAGVLSNTNAGGAGVDTQDYFFITTAVGHQYQANLSITANPNGMKLRIRLYNGSRTLIETSSSSTTDASISWTAYQDSHYIRVEALLVTNTIPVLANYQLDVDELAVTPTPTESPTPTNTPMPGEDDYEKNDTITSAYTLPVATSASATDVNFYPPGDEDWFAFYVKSGRHYRASTSDLVGVDTYLEVYDKDGSKIGSDNDGGGGFASKLEWKGSYDGYYYVKLTNLVASDSDDTYDLTVAEVGAPATNTPGPIPGPIAGLDACEDNTTLDRACVLAANQSRTFNFISPHSGPDNDYFKIWVKSGLRFDCRTSNLSPGVDPNMIVYDQNRNPIGGNDDVEPGDYNSAFSYYATYDGWLYLLVGTGDRTPSDISNSNYTLVCLANLPGQPTSIPAPASTGAPGPTDTPRPGTTPTPMPSPTPTPSRDLTVRTLTTPTPAPAATSAPRFVPISLLVYYDANDDGQPGAGEGIGGISAQAYEAATNQLLAQGFTDDQGHLAFTVAAQGPVRASVPFFGFSQLVAGDGASVFLRVSPPMSTRGAP